MTPAQLKAWMDSRSLTNTQAAEELGISRKSLWNYLQGHYPVPRVVELACEALSLRWKQ